MDGRISVWSVWEYRVISMVSIGYRDTVSEGNMAQFGMCG